MALDQIDLLLDVDDKIEYGCSYAKTEEVEKLVV